MLPHIKYILSDMKSSLNQELYEELDPLENICDLIEHAIQDDPPLAMKEGGIIKDGYHEEIDRLRHAKSDGKEWLANWRVKNRRRPGLKTFELSITKYLGIIWK